MDAFSTLADRYLAGALDDAALVAATQERRRAAMKRQGAVYTPDWIVAAILERIGLTSPDQTIIEPACGHGAFVLPLIRRARAAFGFDWPDTARWFRAQVRACDIDAATVADLRVLVSLLFRRAGVDVPAETLTNIAAADGLTETARPHDIALGNPPYIRTQQMDPAYLAWLRDTFTVAREGNIDIYYAFLAHYARRARRSVFIVPNGCLKATGARRLRAEMFPRVSEIVDFRARLVFPAARTYTCILTADAAHTGPVLYRDGLDDPGRRLPWRALAGEDIHSAPRVALSGLATLADGAYTVTRAPDTGAFHATHAGHPYPIEPGIVRPLIKATRLPSRDALECPTRFILFPYHDTRADTLMTERDLRGRFPGAWAYLTAIRPRLEARDKGKTDRYPAWYAYGRTQGLHDLSNRDVVFVPTMIGGNSVPRCIDTTGLTARFGAPLFVSGFAVTGSAADRAAILSEEFRAYVRDNGTPKPGARELYYAISSKHINAFLAARQGVAAELLT